MKILFLSLVKIDSIFEKGIYTDLLRKLKEVGHSIYIITPREKNLNIDTHIEVRDNVTILKVKTGNLKNVNLIEKGISTITIENKILMSAKKHFRNVKFDLVLYSTPPITFEKIVKYFKKRDKAKTYLMLKDIFPQNSVDLNMMNKNSLIYQYFRKKEKNLYKISDIIGCMSEANKNYILKHNQELKASKVEIFPNSINPSPKSVSSSEKNIIKKKYGLPLNKIIYLYGGNLGKPQGVDFLMKNLIRNEENNNTFFLIVGNGTEYTKLENFFEEYNIKNAKLLDLLPKEDYDSLVITCDVGLIYLDHRFTIPNIPSRLLSYMESSLPVLAATDENTDLGQILEVGKFGLWSESNDVELFNNLVLKMTSTQLRNEYGRNAFIFLNEYYNVNKTYKIIEKHFDI